MMACITLMIAALLNILQFAVGFPNIVPGQSKDEWCQAWKNQVCASDGVTYWNECLFLKKQRLVPGLTNQGAGACEELECSECENESTVSYRVCTSSNALLNNTCLLQCYKEEYPLMVEDSDGCRSHSPSVAEMEAASPAHIKGLMEEFLTQTLDQSESNTTTKFLLKKFQGLLVNNFTLYKMNGRKGWMSEISGFRISDSFSLSSTHFGRVRFHLETSAIKAGYKKFTIRSGNERATSSLAMTVENATLELIADMVADRSCTRFEPVAVNLYEMPAVEIQTSSEFPAHFPKRNMEGFMKETFVTKINEALQTFLRPRMQRVGCLVSKNMGESFCFGAFQRRYCAKGTYF